MRSWKSERPSVFISAGLGAGIGSVEGVKTAGTGVIRAVEGVSGIDTEKLRNLEAALMAKPAPVP